MFDVAINSGSSDWARRFDFTPEMSFNNDISMVITTEALLCNRRPNDAIIKTFVKKVEKWDVDYRLKLLRKDVTDYLYFMIVSNADHMDGIIESFINQNPEFRKVEKATIFFKKMNVYCLINPKNRLSIVISDATSLGKYHYLQAAIPVFIPWFFTTPVTPLETELLVSLTKRTETEYISVLEKMYKEYGVYNKELKSQLENFEKNLVQRNIDAAEYKRTEIVTEINSLKNRLSEYLKKMRDTDIQITGLKQTKKDIISELLPYLEVSTSVEFYRTWGGRIRIIAYGYIEVFDEQLVEDCIENPHSIVYSSNRNLDNEDVKKVLTAIFIEQRFKMKTCAAYDINLEAMSVQGVSDFDFPAKYNNTLPNPHIQRYSCLGDYSLMMMEALQANSITGCLDLCGMSAKSLNFADPYVMEEFMNKMPKYKCIELPNGEITNFRGAVKYLEEDK